MAITLPPDAHKQAIASLKRYATEHLDEEIGDLKAGLLLEFVLEEIGPSIYNKAIRDAQIYIQDRAIDLEGVCFEKEFGYWTPPSKSAAATEPRNPRKTRNPPS
jgi:uncharacterized protein (DUF2164 family)